MTNKEWLNWMQKSTDRFVEEYKKDNELTLHSEMRRNKALEIIAEELIKLNETFDKGSMVEYKVEE